MCCATIFLVGWSMKTDFMSCLADLSHKAVRNIKNRFYKVPKRILPVSIYPFHVQSCSFKEKPLDSERSLNGFDSLLLNREYLWLAIVTTSFYH